MTWSIPALVLIPLGGGLLAFIVGRRGQAVLPVPVSLLTSAAAVVAAFQIWEAEPIRYEIGGWAAPVGISLYYDGLSAFLILMTAGIGTFISLFAVGYFRRRVAVTSAHESALFWPLWYTLWASLNGLFVAGDLFNIYVVFELMGLAAIALVALAGKPEALRAAMRYLIAAFLGSLSYLLGVALLYAEYGVLDVAMLGAVLEDRPASLMAFALMCSGLVLKTALFPMHFWLPPAHSTASAPVSAILSALVVKGSFFVLLRLWFGVFYGTLTISVGHLLGVLGAMAILWGSLQALRQRRLKMLIAHSTVAQIGYMFLIFPITAITVAGPGTDAAGWLNEAWTGVTYQVLSHALAKSAFFLAAGIVVYSFGSDRLGAMRGLYRTLPLTTFAMAMAGMSLIGLPPSSGFVAKWLIMKAAIGSGQWWWIPVIVLGGLLTAGYVVLVLRYALSAAEPARLKNRPSRMLEFAALALALMAIVTGFRLQEPLELLIIGTPFPVETVVEEVPGHGY